MESKIWQEPENFIVTAQEMYQKLLLLQVPNLRQKQTSWRREILFSSRLCKCFSSTIMNACQTPPTESKTTSAFA